MAQTKAKKAKRSSSSKAASAKGARKPKQAAQPRSKRTSARPSRSRNGKSQANTARAAGEAVRSAGIDAGQTTTKAVKKARIPLLAGGTALAGAVGGVVLGASRSGGKVMGVKLPRSKRVKVRSKDIATAAKEVGRFGENLGDLTAELKRAREGLANGNGKHNSPIEILLNSLTNRR
jgi:hypothetical protein